MRWKLLLPLVAVMSSGEPARAQTGGVPDAQLGYVTRGVFPLREGQSMDLSDRGILLTLQRATQRDNEGGKAVFTINGAGGGEYRVGSRVDLKQRRETRDFVKDLRVCVLDLVSVSAPQGAPPSATFRLMCE